MSATTTALFTATSSSPSSTSTDSGSGSGSTSNSLYLFTFLTTLLLLLAVSCGIVLRSFILRRRFRRRVEAAIAAGVLLPEQVEALRRRGPTIGERPTLWEVRIGKGGANGAVDGIHKPGYEYPASIAEGADEVQDDWANVMPVSAAIIPAHSKKHSASSPPEPIPVSQLADGGEDLLHSSRRPRWLRRGRNDSSGPVLPMTAPPPPPESLPSPSGNHEPSSTVGGLTPGSAPTTPGAENLDKLQLTVLIAMPNANARRYQPSMSIAGDATDTPPADRSIESVESEKGKQSRIVAGEADDDDDEEEEIPEVVFGITEVLWDAGVDWTPQAGKTGDADKGDDESGSEPPAAGGTAGRFGSGHPVHGL